GVAPRRAEQVGVVDLARFRLAVRALRLAEVETRPRISTGEIEPRDLARRNDRLVDHLRPGLLLDRARAELLLRGRVERVLEAVPGVRIVDGRSLPVVPPVTRTRRSPLVELVRVVLAADDGEAKQNDCSETRPKVGQTQHDQNVPRRI